MAKKVARTCSLCGAIFQRSQNDVTLPMLCGGKVCLKDQSLTVAQPSPASSFVATSVTASAVRDAEGNIELESPVVVVEQPKPEQPKPPEQVQQVVAAPAAGGMSKEEMEAKLAAQLQNPAAAGAVQGVATCAMCGNQFDASKADPRAVNPMCPDCMATIAPHIPPTEGQPPVDAAAPQVQPEAQQQAQVPVSEPEPAEEPIYPPEERPRVMGFGEHVGPHQWIRFTLIDGGVAFVRRTDIAAVETLDLASQTSRVWTSLPVHCKAQFDVVGTPDEIFKLLPGR